MGAEEDREFVSLLSAARGGDVQALGQLLERYRSYLALLARVRLDARLRRKVDPTDVVQEALLEAYRDFGQLRGSTEGEILGWLRRILASSLANLFRHYLGTQQRNIRLEREIHLELDQSSACLGQILPGSLSTPSQGVMKREEMALLTEALEQLPEHYREIILLRSLEGIPFAEAARRMGRTVDSVEKLWARALLRLRRLMDRAHDAP